MGWLLQTIKLRQMGTQGVHMKGVFPWLVSWVLRASTTYFCPALAPLVAPVQNIFSSPYTISVQCSHHPAGWKGSCRRVTCLLNCVSGFNSQQGHHSGVYPLKTVVKSKQSHILYSVHSVQLRLQHPTLPSSFQFQLTHILNRIMIVWKSFSVTPLAFS